MDKLLILIVPELAKNVPAIVLAVVAAASIWVNATTVRTRWKEMNDKLDMVASTVAPVPGALDKVKEHDIALLALKQEQHDANLMARQYVTRSELIESIGTTGQKIHARVDAVEQQVVRLDERSKR